MMVDEAKSNNSLIPHLVEPDSEILVVLPRSNQKTLEWLAVLGAAGVTYTLNNEDGRWRIIIAGDNRSIALNELGEYEQECRYWPPKMDFRDIGTSEVSMTSLYAAMCLFCFFLVTGPYNAEVMWFYQGQGYAEKMVSGEIWRAVTALTLHSDLSHIAGNVISYIFLGGAVCQYLGNGMGSLLILLSGAGANLLNSMMHGPAYRFVGASTAVFAAIGILGTISSIRLYRTGSMNTPRLFIPLLSVFAILSILGTGPKADILGHFMGTIVGIFLGFLCPLLQPYRERIGIQICSLMVALAMILGSWGFALRNGN